MKRLLHICLLLMALMGVAGQSTAMAMMPARVAAVSAHRSMQVLAVGTDCMDMANTPAPAKAPCKKVTPQCMAATGCAPFALVAPAPLPVVSLVADREDSTPSLAPRLWGRTFGPEPDPPSFLI